MPHRDLRQSYMSGNQVGRPYWYIFNNIGQNKIKFFPVPQENLAQITGVINLNGPSIPDGVIIEYFRTPDINDSNYQIPVFIRRRLQKCYVNARCFQSEGKGVNIKNANYWEEKWTFLKQIYIDLLDDLNNKPRNIVANNQSSRPFGFVPPPPILSVNRYGISVDDIEG